MFNKLFCCSRAKTRKHKDVVVVVVVLVVLTEALALVGGAVDEDLGADDVAEGQEHLHELGVAELLRQVVDEEVAALGAGDGAA